MSVLIRFCPLEPALNLPVYQTPGSSGMDICASQSGEIMPGEVKVFPTGWSVEIPEGYEIQVRSRSGLAAKKGIFVLNSPGTIDSDYRGEIKVILANLGKEPVWIDAGERVAQLVVCPVIRAVCTQATSLSDTERGTGGLGSTGK